MNPKPQGPSPLTITQLAVSSLPLLATIFFALALPELSADMALSFAVLGMALSLHCLHAVRGRAHSAADASVFAFGLMFLLVAPIVQLSVLGFRLVNTTHAVPDLIIQANLACSLFIGSYLLARVTVLKPPLHLPSSPASAAPAINLFTLGLLTATSVLITLVSLPFIGATVNDQGIAPVLLASRKFLFFVPTALFLIVMADYKNSGVQRNFLHVLLLVVLFACVLATQNPGTEKRNALGPVYLAALYFLFRPWLQRRGVQVAWLVGVLLVLFPLTSLFTHIRFDYLNEESFKWEVLSDHFLTTHYDAWANIYTSIEMVGRNGLSGGRQLMGAVLFYVPSTWWPGKPLATGIEIGNFLTNFYMMWFTNLSAPLIAEGFLDFGYAGVAVYGIALAALVRAIERWAAPGQSAFAVAVAVYLSFFIVFLLRGSLMIAFAYGSGALAAFAVSRLLIGLLNAATLPRGLRQPGALTAP